MKANIRKYKGYFAESENKRIIDTYGVKPGTEVELVDTKLFISSYYDTKEVPHYLCRLPNGTIEIIIATDLVIQEGVLDYDESMRAKFRREAAKDILCALVSSGHHPNNCRISTVRDSIALVDELIEQLERKEEEDL